MEGMNTIQETEFLYEWREDRAEGQLPDEWRAHRILKRTKKFVFVEYRVGINHPSRQTMKLDLAKLEANGEIYWSHGTWVICFYMPIAKQIFDHQREMNRLLPECLKVLGLGLDATYDDMKQAF